MPLSPRVFFYGLRGLSAVALAALASALAPRADASDEKQMCVRAVERAQVARLEGKLREAHDGFVTCARAVCPDAIRKDCTRWVTEVEASLPTVVVDAAWADGRDLTGLTVLLDGRRFPEAAAGRAVPLDPGPHRFRFEAPGATPVETRSVIPEGEKNQVLRVVFSPIDPAALAAAREPAPPPTIPPAAWHLEPKEERSVATRRPIPTSAFVVGGFAIAGFGVFAGEGLSGLSQLDHLRATCAPSCDPSQVASARREILVGDIVGYVALLATGVASWLVLTRPTVPSGDETR
jgi:hypothetical protein